MKNVALVAIAALAPAAIGESHSQSYSSRPVRMLVQGVALKSSTPEEFSKLVAEDIATLTKVVKAAGIKVD